jgi:hypothetical protein
MYFLLVFKIVFHVMLQLNKSLNVVIWKLIVSHLVKKFTVCKTASFIVVLTNVHPYTCLESYQPFPNPHIQFSYYFTSRPLK